jgi:hypothetical protein
MAVISYFRYEPEDDDDHYVLTNSEDGSIFFHLEECFDFNPRDRVGARMWLQIAGRTSAFDVFEMTTERRMLTPTSRHTGLLTPFPKVYWFLEDSEYPVDYDRVRHRSLLLESAFPLIGDESANIFDLPEPELWEKHLNPNMRFLGRSLLAAIHESGFSEVFDRLQDAVYKKRETDAPIKLTF